MCVQEALVRGQVVEFRGGEVGFCGGVREGVEGVFVDLGGGCVCV